jgi:hypothetical protein
VVFAAKAKNDQTVPWSILINDDSSTTKGRLVSTVSTQGFAMFAYQWGDTSMGDIGVQNVNPGGTLGPPPLPTCYADCDHVGGLTGNDFQCFLDAFVANSSYADCDGVGGLTGNDFQCFLDKYVAGCS